MAKKPAQARPEASRRAQGKWRQDRRGTNSNFAFQIKAGANKAPDVAQNQHVATHTQPQQIKRAAMV